MINIIQIAILSPLLFPLFNYQLFKYYYYASWSFQSSFNGLEFNNNFINFQFQLITLYQIALCYCSSQAIIAPIITIRQLIGKLIVIIIHQFMHIIHHLLIAGNNKSIYQQFHQQQFNWQLNLIYAQQHQQFQQQQQSTIDQLAAPILRNKLLSN